jgi:hypothetical protein
VSEPQSSWLVEFLSDHPQINSIAVLVSLTVGIAAIAVSIFKGFRLLMGLLKTKSLSE